MIASLGGDGVYRLRVTDGELTQAEHDYAAEVVQGLGVEVASGALFVGPGESLSADDVTVRDSGERGGILLGVPPGQYRADLYLIAWDKSPCWWTEGGQPPPPDAPADVVMILRPRSGSFPGVDVEPRLLGDVDSFLFDSPGRLLGPQPGMLLTSSVRKAADGSLCLKDCGPGAYVASLRDYSPVAWKDRIRLRVLEVDHDARRFVGEYVEHL